MSYAAEFLIEKGILKEYYGAGGEIEIPEGVTDIAPFAFCYCEIERLILPKSLIRLKKDALRRCRSLKTVVITGKNLKFGKEVFSEAPDFPYVVAPELPFGDLPPEVKANCCCGFAKEEGSFRKSVSETYLKYIQHQRKTLYPAALLCDELLRLMLREKFVTRDEAAELVTALSQSGKTELSAEVMRYQSANFKPRDPLKEMLREANRDPYCVTEVKKLWEFERRADGTAKIFAYKGNDEQAAVPPRIGKAVVTELGDLCFHFSNRPRLEKGVKRLPLRRVYLPDSVLKIGKRAFDGCTELEEIRLPENLSELPAGIFEDCRSLTKITLPQGLRRIGTRAFLRCDGLTEMVFPTPLETVDSYAFSACRNLSAITFEGGTEELLTEAFSDCVSLETVVIKEGAKRLGYGAFGGCECLREITLPESLAEIGRNAFYGCQNLTVFAPKDSFAKAYAKEHRMNFKETETEDLK